MRATRERSEIEEGNELVVKDGLLIVSSWRHLLESEQADWITLGKRSLLLLLLSLMILAKRVRSQRPPGL